MDPQHYSPYHHAYYRVGATGVKDHHHHHHQTVESAAQAAAVQTRILEMRKEKSRDAARSRRGKENHEFYELAKMLPLPAAITSQLDKASIIRLTISYLKLRDFALNGDPTWSLAANGSNALKCSKTCNVFEIHQGTHILQSLDGFAFALGQDGRFLYISETVSIYLGLSQVEMTGSSVFDYTHQQDHAELAEQLGLSSSSGSHHHQHHQLSSSPLPPASVGSSASNESDTGPPYSSSSGNHITLTNANDTLERQFCIRMKSTLTKRGCQHFKSSGYRVVHIVSHLRPEMSSHHHQQRRDSATPSAGTSMPKIIGMVAVAIALPPPSINELRLEADMFVTRLSLDFRIAHCEPRVSELLDYSAEELTGRNMYSLIHGQDSVQMRKSHMDLIHKGQVMTNYYRIINKTGGYTWIQTCATLICSVPSAAAKSSGSTSSAVTNTAAAAQDDQDQSIICVNYVLSRIEFTDVIMDMSQLNGGMHIPMAAPTPPTPTQVTKHRTPAAATITKRSSSTASPSPDTHSSTSSHSQSNNNGNTQLEASAPPSASSSSSGHANGSPNGSPVDVSEGAKRRRFNSSPVRPWKSPSPPPQVSGGQGHGGGHHHGGQSHSPVGHTGTGNSSASNLLRHISVIRETPPILKPQVVPPAYHPHHYHHLVDPYAAAYHLYKNGGTGGVMPPNHTAPNGPSAAAHHHWGAYN